MKSKELYDLAVKSAKEYVASKKYKIDGGDWKETTYGYNLPCGKKKFIEVYIKGFIDAYNHQ